jgi:hypothetical protein
MTVVETNDQKLILVAPANLDNLSDALRSAYDATVNPDSITHDGVHRPPPPRPG